jgi:NADH:ubiquinone oxidoreductase subunit K
MYLNEFLLLSLFLFCVGIYGALSRRSGVLVLMSIELMLNAANVNLVAFSAFYKGDAALGGQVFALFVIAIAAAEVGVGLAIVLLLYRNLASADVDRPSAMKG